MEVETLLYLKGNDPIGDTPIFNFHDHWRKGHIIYLVWAIFFFGIVPCTNNSPFKFVGLFKCILVKVKFFTKGT